MSFVTDVQIERDKARAALAIAFAEAVTAVRKAHPDLGYADIVAVVLDVAKEWTERWERRDLVEAIRDAGGVSGDEPPESRSHDNERFTGIARKVSPSST